MVCFGGHAWQGGACMAGGHVWQGVCMAGGMEGRVYQKRATVVGGTLPTGMHSCIQIFTTCLHGMNKMSFP